MPTRILGTIPTRIISTMPTRILGPGSSVPCPPGSSVPMPLRGPLTHTGTQGHTGGHRGTHTHMLTCPAPRATALTASPPLTRALQAGVGAGRLFLCHPLGCGVQAVHAQDAGAAEQRQQQQGCGGPLGVAYPGQPGPPAAQPGLLRVRDLHQLGATALPKEPGAGLGAGA